MIIGRSACALHALCAPIIFLPVHGFAAEPAHKPHYWETKQSEIRKIFLKQIQAKWTVVLGLEGADKVRVRALLKLDRAGALLGEPRITATGGPRGTCDALAASAYRAILRAVPFQDLPQDQYNDWREIVVDFSVSDPVL
jgi:hypothetical protein